jgi:hypothetical protein
MLYADRSLKTWGGATSGRWGHANAESVESGPRETADHPLAPINLSLYRCIAGNWYWLRTDSVHLSLESLLDPIL